LLNQYFGFVEPKYLYSYTWPVAECVILIIYNLENIYNG